MQDQFQRTCLLYGREGMKKLYAARVIIFGIGGVGGYAAEALARSGVSRLALVDSDVISLSNLNRQIIATHASLGRYKVDAMLERILDINPKAQPEAFPCFYLPETADRFCFNDYDYIVDAVDTVTAKLEIIARAKRCGVPVISSMGTGNKTRPDLLRIADIEETRVDPLARVMRRECRKRGIGSCKVVYSEEEPIRPVVRDGTGARPVPGSTAFVPAAAGLLLAGEVVRDLIGTEKIEKSKKSES